MDLYNSQLTGYHSNQSPITKTKAQNRAIAEASSTKNSTSTEQGKSPELKEGQILKGQVLDYRNNQVTIQLEPGNQRITARLSGVIPLSIGQEAMFSVTGEASGSYVLKYLPENDTRLFDATIVKALTASGFPITDRNKAMVAELLAKRLPIDKQTLQVLLRVALANQEASPQTLILMYKNRIPLTSANIKQFEAYQSGTHQLVNDLGKISQNISELLQLTPLEMNSADHPVSYALKINQALIDILYSTPGTSEEQPSTLSNSFDQTQLKQLSKLFEQFNMDNPSFSSGLTAELASKIQSGTLSLSESTALFAHIMESTSNQEAPPESSNGSTQNIFTKENLSLITKLMDDYDSDPHLSSQLLKILTPQERLNFTELLKGFLDLPNAQMLNDHINKGIITVKELFTFLQEHLPNLDKGNVAKLIQCPEYAKLLETAFLNKWTIPPKKFADKAFVNNILRELAEDLDQLQALTKDQASLSVSEDLQNPVQNLKENLQFMKDLNQTFPYLQLPVQFKNQNAHTELYVFSKKKTQIDQAENLSVLLHLEMLNLGSLNIYLQLLGSKQIQADFYVEDKETGLLIKDQLESLTTALQAKAYSLKATVTDTYNKPDFSKDFIEQNSEDSSVKRYTFDIRT